MADDTKPDIQEDWDKLPLDPDAADDWDDIPPPPVEKKGPASSTSTALEKVSPAEDYFEAQTDRLNKLGNGKQSLTAPEAADDDFDSPADEIPPETPDDFEVPPVEDDPLPDDDDFDAAAESAPEEPPVADEEEIPLPNISEPKPPSKKVELDIEGMQFKADQPPAEEEPEEDPEEGEPEPPREAAPPKAEEPAAPEGPSLRRKIPRLKLLLIVGPALLLLLGLVFGLMALFSDPEPVYVPPPPPDISPELPLREATAGEMRLESFYVSFPGRANDTIIELSLILHYNDTPDALLIRDKLTPLRDIIYRVAQGKGSLIITDSTLQGVLREELRERANLLLGGEYISYVQIDQIRILQ